MLVSDVMTTRIVSVEPNATVKAAAELMNTHNIGAVPVVKGQNVEGMITDRDIVLRCVAENRSADSVRVSDICSKGTVSVKPDENLKSALNVMASQQIRRLPVVDSGKLVGMLSLADIAREKSGMELAEAISDISMP